MKKLITISFICAAVAISCGKKIMPESEAGTSANSETSKTDKDAGKSTNKTSSTIPTFNNMQQSETPPVQIPNPAALDKGKAVYVAKCGSCHALKNVHDYSASRWNEILKVEIPRAKLNNEESDHVTAFILAKAK